MTNIVSDLADDIRYASAEAVFNVLFVLSAVIEFGGSFGGAALISSLTGESYLACLGAYSLGVTGPLSTLAVVVMWIGVIAFRRS